ncbi:MAG: response regulator [Jatrophihabitans sp.]
MSVDSIRVVVADDNPVVLRGLITIINAADGLTVVGNASDGEAAVAATRRTQPDVVLLDVRMPGMDGLAAARLLAADYPVLMLTFSEDSEIVAEALAAGARGYLVHGNFSPAELVAAIRGTTHGAAHLSPHIAAEAVRLARLQLRPLVLGDAFALSPREVEVMDLVVQGRSNAEIAAALFLSEKTVKNNLTRTFVKLSARNRAEAAAVYTGNAPRPSAGERVHD